MKLKIALMTACIATACASTSAQAHTITFSTSPTISVTGDYTGYIHSQSGGAISNHTVSASMDWETYLTTKSGASLFDSNGGILTVDDHLYATWTPDPGNPLDVPGLSSYTVEWVMRENLITSAAIGRGASNPPWNPFFTGSGTLTFGSGFGPDIYLSVSSTAASTCLDSYSTGSGLWDDCGESYSSRVFVDMGDGTYRMDIEIDDASTEVSEDIGCSPNAGWNQADIGTSTVLNKEYSVVLVADATFTPYS